MTPLKKCSRCGIEKPVEEFALRSSIKKGLVPRTYCIDCDVEKVPTPEENQRKALMRRYGLTPAQVKVMGEAQRWNCAICHTDIQKQFFVDHDHVTGKVRKLLCMNCNVGLGHFKDSTVVMQAAIDYIVRENKRITLGLE